MFCPVCKDEYREGFTHCAECRVDLVPTLPKEKEKEVHYVALAPLMRVSNPVEAQSFVDILANHEIYAATQGDDCGGLDLGLQFIHGVRILVQRDKLDESRKLLASHQNLFL